MVDFPPCVVINMDRDTDRLAFMQAQFDKLGIPFERFPAIAGRDLPDHLRPFFTDSIDAPPDHALLSAGELGCYASHLELCRRIADGRLAAPAMVFEDDIVLPPDFRAAIEELLRVLPDGWDVVRLSNPTKHAFLPLRPLGAGRQLIRFSDVPDSAGALLWSKSGARKFARDEKRVLAVDQDLRRLWVFNLDTYGVTPPLIQRDALDISTIDSMTEKGWRGKGWRKARMRGWRKTEALARHRYGAGIVGWGRWLELLSVNAAARLVPKPKRAQYIDRRCRSMTASSMETPR